MSVTQFFAGVGLAGTLIASVVIGTAMSGAGPSDATPALIPLTTTPTASPLAAGKSLQSQQDMAQPEPAMPNGLWQCDYYANRDMLDRPAARGTYGDIAFNWARRSPLPGLPRDAFSMRCEGTHVFQTLDNYAFHIVANDGARLLIDDQIVANEWHIGQKDFVVHVPLTPGAHRLRLDYYDATGLARLAVKWQPAYDAWIGRYYADAGAAGPLIAKRNDGKTHGPLKFDSGLTAPLPGLPADGFSVIWEQRVRFAAGTYTFAVDVQGGARVFIDGEPLHDDLNRAGRFEVQRRLSRGEHLIQVFYVEHGGHARLSLDWR